MANSTGKISIIIPVYNSASFLDDCIGSIRSQSYKNIEIVAVNDGSTDNSAEILDALKADDFKVIHQENGGVSAARNVGIKNATGEYVCFVDADDILPENSLQNMIDGIGDADIYTGRIFPLSAYRSGLDKPNNEKKRYSWCGSEMVRKCIEDNFNIQSSCGKLYRYDVVKDIEFPVGYKYNEDSYFVFLTATTNPKINVVDEIAYLCRENLSSASRKGFVESKYDMIKLAEKKHAIVLEKYPEFKDIADNFLLRSRMSYLNNLIDATSKGTFKRCVEQKKIIEKLKYAYISSDAASDMLLKRLTTYFLIYYAYRKLRNFVVGLKNKKLR